jgi:hypothetical protein
MLPDGHVPAVASNVIFLKYVPEYYLADAYSLFIHSAFYLGLQIFFT